MKALIGSLLSLVALTAQAGDNLQTRAGVLQINETKKLIKLTINGKELKRGNEIAYSLPEAFQSKLDINGAEVFVFEAYTSNICRYFFVIEVPSAPAKPKVHKEQTHILCGGPQADDEVDISQQGNTVSLTVPDYPDPKTHMPVAKTYTYTIGD